jgi:hypothetical protein
MRQGECNKLLTTFRGEVLCDKCLLSDSLEDEMRALAPEIQNENVCGGEFRGHLTFQDSWDLSRVMTSKNNWHPWKED